MYQFIIINPRQPVVPPNTLGIEVTVPEIAAMCDLGNVDPQHGCQRGPGGSNSFPAVAGTAITEACGWPLPADGATFATIRPDLDAFGAMAVLALRTAGVPVIASGLDRIKAIAAADSNTATTWTPRALPSAENPWPAGNAVDSRRELAAIAAVVSDHKLSVPFRVACVATWILGGECPTWEQSEIAIGATLHQHLQPGFWPAGPGESEDMGLIIKAMSDARARAEAERADMIAALADGRITITLASCPRCDGVAREHERGDAECVSCGWDFPRTAIVRSTHRAATMIGQSVAPLAICFHPAFRWPQGHTTQKATIAWAVPPGAEVVARVRDALNVAERAALAAGMVLAWNGAGFFASPIVEALEGIAAAEKKGAEVRNLSILTWLDEARNALLRWSADPSPLVARTKVVLDLIESGGGWGGNLASGILGSPQGRASALSEEQQIVHVVRGAL